MAATPESLDDHLDRLIEVGVLAEDPGLRMTEAFLDTWGIYAETYSEVDEATFRGTVADLFDLPAEETGDRIDRLDVTRDQVAAFLALRSHLDDPPERDTLAVWATLVAEVGPPSPVSAGATTVDDETFERLVADGDVVLTVWARQCEPCRALKREFDAVAAAAPDGVRFAGAIGGETPALRRAHDVTAAPTTLLFVDGELVERVEGRRTVETFASLFERVYGDG